MYDTYCLIITYLWYMIQIYIFLHKKLIKKGADFAAPL
jgi:hypothetical protein